MATQVPIGMIDISRGGTCVETWTPIEVLRAMDDADMRKLLGEWDTKVKDWDPKKELAQRVATFRQRQKDGKVPADAKEPTQPGPSSEVDHEPAWQLLRRDVRPDHGPAGQGRDLGTRVTTTPSRTAPDAARPTSKRSPS